MLLVFVVVTAKLVARTVIFDLPIGVVGGLVIAAVLFLRRMESVTTVRLLTAENDNEHGGVNAVRGKDVPPGVVLFRFEGPLFLPRQRSCNSHCARTRESRASSSCVCVTCR